MSIYIIEFLVLSDVDYQQWHWYDGRIQLDSKWNNPWGNDDGFELNKRFKKCIYLQELDYDQILSMIIHNKVEFMLEYYTFFRFTTCCQKMWNSILCQTMLNIILKILISYSYLCSTHDVEFEKNAKRSLMN